MDTLMASRRQRRMYYITILLGFVIAVPLAIVTKWFVYAVGIPRPTAGIIVMMAPTVEVAVAIAYAVFKYLRCPQCKASDPALAWGRPMTRRCPACGAEIA